MLTKPTAEQVKAAREAASLTQKQTAEIFGYSLRAWQRKEESGDTGRSLSVGEYQYLLLLADSHQKYKIIEK